MISLKTFSAKLPVGVALLVIAAGVAGLVFAKAPRQKSTHKKSVHMKHEQTSQQPGSDADGTELEKATFGGGCFWCTEAVFQRLKGVHRVVSGYSGGETNNPTYEQVCTGLTGHAEAIQITYDPKQVSYADLLEVFWKTHDSTTLNQQGADFGTQYRSAIFYHSDEQKELAEQYKKQLESEHVFRKPIVTEITEFTEFYPAEDHHQNYYNSHRSQGYCRAVINPKISKLNKVFRDKLKDPHDKNGE